MYSTRWEVRQLTPSLADLTELGRTPVAVISSGCKSFLDIPRTLEYLETEGVLVGAFADGRTGRIDFPAFFSRESGIPAPRVIRDEYQAAAIIRKNPPYRNSLDVAGS
jgi:pseudouridine-5'-phosphate glycosidase